MPSARGPAGSLFLVHGDVRPPTVVPGDEVVALTPGALEACRAGGLRPTVLDDHVGRPSAWTQELDHLRWELGWLDRLDSVAGGAGAARAAAFYIVTPVDAVVRACWLLRALTETIGPARVVYVGPTLGASTDPVPFHSGHLRFLPRLGDAPLASRLLPLLAKELNLPYEEVVTPWPAWPGTPSATGRRRWVVSHLASLRNSWPAVVTSLARSHREDGDTTLSCWTHTYGARCFIESERRQGHRLLFLARRRPSTRLLAPSVTGFRPVSAPIPVVPDVRRAVLPPAARPLLNEVDVAAGVEGAVGVVESRLAFFLGALVPMIERAAATLQPELERHGVARIAATDPSSIEEFAALLAARRASVASTLYQHGDHLLPYETWFATELQTFDRLATSDVSLVGDIPDAARRLGAQCPKVIVRSPRVEQLRQRRRRIPSLAPTCYLPSFFMGDGARVGASNIDDAWYHRWHLRLLGFMATHAEQQFIWKGLPSHDEVPDPLAERLRAGGVPNVRFESRPFQAVLPEVGRVISDYPSTGLYEAVHHGRAVLALIFPRFVEVRPRAVALFDPVIRTCANEMDAIAEIERFLQTDPEAYTLDSTRICPPSS